MSKITRGLAAKIAFVSFAILSALGSAPEARAAVSPVAAGIVPPVQFPPKDFSITGLRVSPLYGHHRDLYGLDFGVLGNVTDQSFVGLAVSGLFNVTKGATSILGLQLAGIANVNVQKTDIYGFQVAGIINSNTAASTVTGVQFAAVNMAKNTDIRGVQAGIYNVAQEVYGFQIGLVNVASNLHGVQIGLVNFNLKGLFYVAPVLNVGF